MSVKGDYKRRTGLSDWAGCPGRSQVFLDKMVELGDNSHSGHVCDLCRCPAYAGRGTDHRGYGFCVDCEKRAGRVMSEQMLESHREVVDKGGGDLPVAGVYGELLQQEVKFSEQQMEVAAALRKAKDILEDMQKCHEEFKGRLEGNADPAKLEALGAMARAVEGAEFVDPEQGVQIMGLIKSLSGKGDYMTERGKDGPIEISDDTRYKLSMQFSEQMRRNVETIAKTARDYFDMGKGDYIQKALLVRLLIPGLVEILRHATRTSPAAFEHAIKRMHILFSQINEEAAK